MAAKIIPFPGPKQKTLLDLAQAPETTVGLVPAPMRPLNEREVQHRRQMLMHLQCASDSAKSR